jgi:Ca2+-binding RTX toxin-like protein
MGAFMQHKEATTMVFKALLGGTGGNLYNATDFLGYYDDTVVGGYETATYIYDIFTFRGNDIIDVRDMNASTTANFFAGSGDDIVYGSAGSNFYVDQSGNDRASLGSGADNAYAGTGNDTIDGGGGTDTIDFIFIVGDLYGPDNTAFVNNTSGVTFDLQKTTVQDLGVFGKDTIRGFENAKGSNGGDILYGSAGVNEINGQGGNDYIDGRDGNDVLLGNEGSDTLRGNKGGDSISLGEVVAARDHVRYYYTSESYAATSSVGQVDWISGFNQGGGSTDDKIDLSRIDAKTSSTTYNNTFVFEGTGGAFDSSSGEIRIVESGGNSYVYVDTDSDSSIEMRFVVAGVTGLTADDFIL